MAAFPRLWAIRKPITNRLITPDTRPPQVRSRPHLVLWGAPGQYVPASLAMWSTRDVRPVRLAVGALRCGRRSIAPECVDVRTVKCWYMAGLGVWAEPRGGTGADFDVTSIGEAYDRCRDAPGIDGCGYVTDRRQLWLAPELLLKDDALIDFDRARMDNVFRFTGMPTDAPTLQPFALRGGETKQIWITVHVPEDAEPGQYAGRLRVAVPRHGAVDIPLTLEILPVQLGEPAVQYMMYYGGFLTTKWGSVRDAHFRSAGQMLAELKDLRAHGVSNTEVPEWIDGDRPDGRRFDFSHLDRVMDLREAAGFPVRKLPLLWAGGPNMLCQLYKHDPWVIDQARLKQIERTTRALMAWSRRRGIPAVYIYAVDEVQDAKLRQEIRAIRLIKSLGARIAMAVKPNFHDYLGDLVDWANVQGDPHDPKQIPPKVIRRMHARGGLIFNYARPQTGECRPHMYRRNYGIDMYLSELDGPCPYGYMAMSGRYQAYDRIHTTHGRWLNHPFSYPTTDGVIPTWGSQGWRAAVDDVRYVTTLRQMVDAGAGTTARRARARAFLDGLDSDADLDAMRRRCVRHIVGLGG